MKVLGKTFWLLSHPDHVEAVLVKHARIMMRDDYISVLKRIVGEGLLTSEGDLWKRQRKLMSQAFTPRRIHDYGAAMVRVTDAGLASWRGASEINLHAEMSRLTMEVVADVLFGTNVAPRDVETVRDALEILQDYRPTAPRPSCRSRDGCRRRATAAPPTRSSASTSCSTASSRAAAPRRRATISSECCSPRRTRRARA
jgi:cytochrome P450